MHDDIEYRRALARTLREAGVSFDVIANVLRERTRLAHQRQRLQSSTKHIQEHQATHYRQDVALGMRQQKANYGQIGAALGVTNSRAHSLVKKAQRRASIPAWLNGLDLRTAKVLLRAGFQSVEEVSKAIAAGAAIERVQAPRRNMIEAWLQTAH